MTTDDGLVLCMDTYGLPRYPNNRAAREAIPDGWQNRARLFRCGGTRQGHTHVGQWRPGDPHPTPLPVQP